MPRNNPDDSNNDANNTNVIDDQNDQNGGNNNAPVVDPPEPTGGNVEFASMNQREQALVQKARAEEKRKLYKQQKERDDQIAELRTQIAQLQNAPPPPTPRAADTRADKIDALVESVNALAQQQRDTNARIERMSQDEVKRRQASELRIYAQEQIAALRARGEDLIEGLVGGDSEDEIDDSIKIAHAEWNLTIQKHEAKTRSTGQPPTSVTVQGNGRGRPTGTPPVQVPNSVEADSNQETIDDLTSNDAVRDGTYEKNRSKLFGGIKRGYKYTGNQPAS
jgi:hypothetical protein